MFIEHLFIFSPGFLFLTGVGIFFWLLVKITVRGKKNITRRNTSSLKGVLSSVASPAENISIEKFLAYTKNAQPSRLYRGKALATHVYPEPMVIPLSGLIAEIKQCISDFQAQTDGLRKKNENMYNINITTQSKEGYARMNDQLQKIQKEKEDAARILTDAHAHMDTLLKEKERVIAELMEKYELGQARRARITDNQKSSAQNVSGELHGLVQLIRQVRQDARVQVGVIQEEQKSIEQKHAAIMVEEQEQHDKIVQESLEQQETLERDISRLRAEIQDLRQVMPRIIAEKDEQISQMRSALALMEARIRKEEDHARQTIDRLNRHMNHRIMRAKELLEQVTTRSREQCALQEAACSRLKQEVFEKEHDLKKNIEEVFQQHKNIYTELVAEKEQLAGEYKEASGQFEEENKVREHELVHLRQLVAEREETLRTAVAMLENKKSSEKQRLSAIIAEIQSDLQKEQGQSTQEEALRIAELSRIRKESEEAIKTLQAESESQCAALTDANARLKEFIEAERKRIEFNRQMWADSEKKMNEEKETIRQRIDACEKNMVQEQEKQHASYALETAELNQQIKSLEEELKRVRTEHRSMTEKSSWEIECLTVKEKRNEEKAKELWLAREAECVRDQSKLEEELKNVNEHIERSSEAAEKKRLELIGSIKSLRKDLEQKGEYSESMLKQRDREYKKMIQPLNDKIADIRSTIVNEKRMYEAKLAEMNDKIHTMKLKLAWRDERQQANDLRRQREIEKFRDQLHQGIDALRIKAHKMGEKQDRMLEPFLKEYDRLSGELKETEEKLAAETTAYEELKKSRMELEAEITQLEQRIPQDMEQYVRLLHMKEKHIQALNREVNKKEQQLDVEEFISREAMQKLRASARHLHLDADKLITAKQKDPAE